MNMNKSEILNIVGDKLSANEFEGLMAYLSSSYQSVYFDNDVRIAIQKEAEKINNGISGSQFGVFLNKEIAPRIKFISKKH